MNDTKAKIPTRPNEVILQYAKGSQERILLEKEIERMKKNPIDIPLIIDGKEVRTGRTKPLRCPHDHNLILGQYHEAGPKEIEMALESARKAKLAWANMRYEERASVFLKAANLISAGYRYTLNAATMLGQSKSVYQAEIDATCEAGDFLSINPRFAEEIYANQPDSAQGEWNRMDYRALDGFVYAVSPFNFTAIGANLASAPALMGNTVIWKPASSSILSNYYVMQLLMQAGLSDGVIQFLPGKSSEISEILVKQKDFAGLHFTGSTQVFNSLYKSIANNLDNYKSYPRIVGETGGKDFIFVHPDSDFDAVITGTIRGSFEYQGQKCSAASRIYIPASKSKELLERLTLEMKKIKLGSPEDYSCFVNAVIDENAFNSITQAIDRAKKIPSCKILSGGNYDKSKGWFIEPTLILSDDPKSEPMTTEIFGPVLTAYIYDDADMKKAYELVDGTSGYALTGAIFARSREAIIEASDALRFCAGNFYINDKPTGAVVGRQPFGGGRGSGTNDKAGSFLNLMRWVSPRCIKENFTPPHNWTYPFME